MQLEIQKYLLSGNSLDSLTAEYGINCNRHKEIPNLIQFKYDQIESHNHRADSIVKECRGLILDEANDWNIISFPFYRFFNYGDTVADEIDWNSAVVQEKVDGSLTQLYFYNGLWHVASSGLPDASGQVGLEQITFKDLFWRIFESQMGKACLWNLPTNMTYMFELCSHVNRVVIRHPQEKLVFLGARNLTTWQEVKPENYLILLPNTTLPEVYPIYSAKEAVEQLSKLNGEEHEGYVIVDAQFNRIKMKCPSYVALSHLAGKLVSMRLVFENVIMREETAEVVAVFPEHGKLLWEADAKYHALIKELEDTYAQHKDIENQKEFALSIKNCRCTGALFALRAGKIGSIREWLETKLHIDNLIKVLGYK